MVTGESLPVDKGPGDEVIGATINTTGAFRFRATKVGADTALASIVRMVGDAQATKLPIQRVVDQVAGVFVPAVMIVAIAAFVVWYDLGPTPALAYAVIVAVTVLIIACPCALGLATPTSLTVGMGKGAEQGVLFRGGDALQASRQLDTLVLDKTGTITHGKPALTDVFAAPGFGEDEVLRLAAAVDRGSEHPLAQAIVAGAAERGLTASEPERFVAVPGTRRRGACRGPGDPARQPQAARRPRHRGGRARGAGGGARRGGQDADVPGRRRPRGRPRGGRRHDQARLGRGDRPPARARASRWR